MSSPFLACVVDTLSLSTDESKSCSNKRAEKRSLAQFSIAEWSHQLGILDRAGLTLPLYSRLLESGESAGLQPQILAALEQRRHDNELRMSGMLETFGQAVSSLQGAGIQFLCVKGFSLVPEYLTELWQRHQIDFDLVVLLEDQLRAQSTLERLGYQLSAIDGAEIRLRIPVSRALDHDAYLYSPQEGAAIELHTAFWEPGKDGIHFHCPDNYFEQAKLHTVGSISFPSLARHHAFLYQVLHVFRHFLASWARLLWFYEIAAFINRCKDDDPLWRKVRELVCTDRRMSEAVALVLLTARDLFGCQIPQALKDLCALPVNSPVAIWITRYARPWLFTDMPGNKLNLLLLRHFFSDSSSWRHYLTDRLVPRRKKPVLCEGLEKNVAISIAYRAANLRFRIGRIWHHLSTDARFAVASIAWEMTLRANQNPIANNEPQKVQL